MTGVERLHRVAAHVVARPAAVSPEVAARPPDWPASFGPLFYEVAVPRFALSDAASATQHLVEEGCVRHSHAAQYRAGLRILTSVCCRMRQVRCVP